MWFTERYCDKVGKITPAGIVTEYSLPAGSEPYGIAAGSNVMWFTEAGTHKIGKISMAGAVTQYAMPAAGYPAGITFGRDGNLWIADFSLDSVWKMSTLGVFTKYSIGISNAGAEWIAAGSDGNLWVTVNRRRSDPSFQGKIVKVTTAGISTAYSAGGSPGETPWDITVGPDGDLWYSLFGMTGAEGNKIARMSVADGSTQTFKVASGDPYSGPWGITAGYDGNIWYSQRGSTIGKVLAGGQSISAVSPDGGLPSGGTKITLSGTGFMSGMTVSLDDVPCLKMSIVSTVQATCNTPPHAEGSVAVTVRNLDGTSTTKSDFFTYRSEVFIVSSSPTKLPVAGGQITLTGRGFLGGATVSVDGTPCADVIVVSGTSITCVAPDHAQGGASITVRNSSGATGTLGAGNLTYLARPVLVSISPTALPLGGGTVRITGRDFYGQPLPVIFYLVWPGYIPCVISSVNLAICTFPPHAVGTVRVAAQNMLSQQSLSSLSLAYAAAPTVTAVSPAVLPLAGGSVTITGTGFLAGATATVGGASCASLAVVSATSVTCTAAAHAAGAVPVVVANSDGQSATLAGAVNYRAAPTVAAVSPAGLPLAGGSVTITGTGFLTGAVATVGGASCTTLAVVSAAEITCTAAAHAAGGVPVVVVNTDGQSDTLASAVMYRSSAPRVTAVSPTVLPVAGGSVTITGTGFLAGATATVGGASCSSFAVVSATSVTCTAAAHAAGAVPVVVANSDGQSATLAGAVNYRAAPTVAAVSPAGLPLAGGSVTITGTGFLTGAVATVGGASCTTLAVVSAAEITCTAAAHAAGGVPVVVVNTDGQSDTLASAVMYRSSAPRVTAVSPTVLPLAGGSVTITGTGFLAGVTATVGGASCASLSAVSSTSVTCTAAAHAVGAVSVVATNSDSQAGTLVGGVTFVGAPRVLSVAPTRLPAAGGLLTLGGSGFLAGATVTVGGASCASGHVVSVSTLTCTAPSHSAGVVAVMVTGSDGQSATLQNAVTYLAPVPAVDGFSPPSGPVVGGTLVTITGSNFDSSAIVNIGTSRCVSVVVVSSSTITCVTPSGLRYHYVSVVNPDGQTGSSSQRFIYFGNSPWINSITPNHGPMRGGTPVVIVGTDFLPGAIIRLDNAVCAITAFTNTSIACTTGVSTTAGFVDVILLNPKTGGGYVMLNYRERFAYLKR